MNQLIRNRLIGGGVLLFAGMLFAPAILSPKSQPIKNPALAIDIQTNHSDHQRLPQPPEANTANVATAMANQTPPKVTLESIDTDESIAVTETTSRPRQSSTNNTAKLTPISLESIAPEENTKVKPQPSQSQPIKYTSWLRVGSFASAANANSLANRLKKNRFSVKIESTVVSGKTFRRVMVGPFTDEKKMRAAMKKIKDSGYDPSIQH